MSAAFKHEVVAFGASDLRQAQTRLDRHQDKRRRPTSPINSRTTPIRSACVRRSSESGMPVVIPSLNHIFEPLTPPPARKFAPVTNAPANSLIIGTGEGIEPRHQLAQLRKFQVSGI